MSRCFKCQQGIGTVVSRDGPKALYCTDCFLHFCTNTVRDSLFQQCFLACDTPVAVAVSGGPNSMLLLRELGQLRHKTREQYHRQHHHMAKSSSTSHSGSALTAATSTPLAKTFDILPFYLCEAELILPPSLTPATASAPTASAPPPPSAEVEAAANASALPRGLHARHDAVERVRATMQAQFDILVKLVQQQPCLWTHLDEAQEGKKKQKKQQKLQQSSGATAASGATVDTASCHGADRTAERETGSADECKQHRSPTAHLFERGEVRVFRYSDFLPAAYIAEVRHILHASKVSLTDREELYARVRQQVLSRAAQRVTEEFRQQRESEGDGCALSPSPWCHLLVGTNAAVCATAALQALVTGAAGDGVVHQAAFRGLLHDVVWLRPLRTLLPRETVLCTRLHGITGGYTPALRTGTALRSMHQVMEHFVHTMLLSFRTMIFNVLNTVQRLEVHPASIQHVVQGVGAAPSWPSTSAAETAAADTTSLASSRNTDTRARRKALPSRTAQQNRDALAQSTPPVVLHHPSALPSTQSATDAHAIDGHNLPSVVAVQCCVCGCPGSAPHFSEAHEVPRPEKHPQLDMTAVSSAAGPTPLDGFVCRACQGLLNAWPPSVLEASLQPTSTAEGNEADGRTPVDHTAVLRNVCALFQLLPS